MPRANRYYTEGRYFHLTHRCHNRSFLLRFARDRDLYRRMLRERARAHAVSLLGYSFTCNHVHLLASAACREAISGMMHDLAGEFAKAYNLRKGRKNAFWGERYQATLIEGRTHLWACMRYIDLNMVRAGVVVHPREWGWCGYQELSGRRQRYRLIDREELMLALDMGDDWGRIVTGYEEDLLDRIARDRLQREWEWTESLAVGSRAFVERMKPTIKGRLNLEIEEASGTGSMWVLKEETGSYA